MIKTAFNRAYSFRSKITMIFLLMVLANLLVVGFIVNIQVKKNIEKDVKQLSAIILNQANTNIEIYLKEYQDFLFNLGTSYMFQNWMNTSKTSKDQSIVSYAALVRDYIRPFANNHPELISIQLYYAASDNLMNYSNAYGYKLEYSVREEQWISESPASNAIRFEIHKNAKYVDNVFKMVDLSYVSMVKSFDYKDKAYINIDWSPGYLNEILQNFDFGEGVSGFIINRQGLIFAHTDKSNIAQSVDDRIDLSAMGASTSGYYAHNRNLVLFHAIENTDLITVFVIPYDVVMSSIDVIRNAVIISSILCIIVSVSLFNLISSSLTKRLVKLKNALQQTGEGNISAVIPVEGRDEISVLAQSYNNMLIDLKSYIQKLSESKLAEHQAVFHSLQSQIDVHFLYNTLEIINAMATQSNNEEIENITISLARMFRYSANYMSQDVTIKEEVAHLENYLKIIEFRFKGLFSYDIEVDAEIEDVRSIKVVLQPLAENSVKHGFGGDAMPLHLSIRIRRYDLHAIEYLVSDNGTGFPDDTLTQLRQQLQQADANFNRGKIGLLNIRQRLWMQYPNRVVALEIGNNESSGAFVRIVFPMQT